MHKFKVGDKVRILDESKIKDYTDGWVYTMGNFVGREATIKSLKNCIGRPAYLLYGNVFTRDERGLELVEQKGYTHKIVCISSAGEHFIAGKIYEVKEGELRTETGEIFRSGMLDDIPYSNIDEINKDLRSKFIELVEEDK